MDEDLRAELREQFEAAGLDEDSIDAVLVEIAPVLEGE